MEQETKAGHLPAEKVGGRRVINKKERRASENGGERTNSESSGEDALATMEQRDTTLMAQMDQTYPTAAVKAKHEKPIPINQYQNTTPPSSHVRQTNSVFQPRRFN